MVIYHLLGLNEYLRIPNVPEIGRCVNGEKVKTIDTIDNVPILSWSPNRFISLSLLAFKLPETLLS